MNLLQDITIDGRDVSIYETEDGITLDIKHPCGELIKGWCGLENYYTAERLADAYINALGSPEKAHCDNEYCQETHSDKPNHFITAEWWNNEQ